MSTKLIDHTYEVVTDSVAAENVEGEVIIVHFNTGSYFSLRGAAAVAWDELTSGVSPVEFASRVDAEADLALDQVNRFLEVLIDEELIRQSTREAIRGSAKDPLKLDELIVEKYEDMQLLLLGDPIHDVESGGWPHLTPDSAQV